MIEIVLAFREHYRIVNPEHDASSVSPHMTRPPNQPEEDVLIETDIDPFEVLDVAPLWRSVTAFVLTLPLTLIGVAGIMALTPFVVTYFRGLSPKNKDRVAHFLLFWLMLGTKFRIKVIDHNPSRADHAQLYIAPHICIMEPFVLMRVLGYIRPVAASMSKSLPIAGKFIEASNPIYVERGKSTRTSSTPTVVDQLRESIQTTSYRHMIFPEGTYTNGKTLIEFKAGAFAIGVPVTPTIFHFPEHTPFWNREESSFLTQAYRLVASFVTPVTLEFLPTYYPSPEELADPKLYAHNMRVLMSRHTGRPLSDRSVYDSPNYKQDVKAS